MAHRIHQSIPLLVLLLARLTGAITIFPSNTEPRAYNHTDLPAAACSIDDVFRQSCPNEFKNHKNATVLYSNTSALISNGHVYPTSDGFVRGAIDAWAQHQHLVLRPDEVWFSILAQMNFYMQKNAEAVRHLFVNHAGKNTIVVKGYTVQEILAKFGRELQERVKTDWLLDWILPNFTTSKNTDVLTANILMMGLMKQYFDYSLHMICGLPSVTLLGEKNDWELLLARLDRLTDFGKEPAAYATQLRPILSRFVQTFDTPDDTEIRRFWNTIVQAEEMYVCGLPPFKLSGWLMGFFFWDQEGNKIRVSGIDALPVGYAQVPFKLIDFNGTQEIEAYAIAGNIGKEINVGLPRGYAEAMKRFNGSSVNKDLPHGTLQPVSGWIIYGPAPPLDTAELQRALDTEMQRAEDADFSHTDGYDYERIRQLTQQLSRAEDIELGHLNDALARSYAKEGMEASQGSYLDPDRDWGEPWWSVGQFQ